MYYVLYGLVRFFSILPLPVLYFFADVIYVFVYYVTGYRKKVVMKNLSLAFPEKTEKERRRIAKDFYHQLIDTFIETIKFFSWNIEEVNRRMTVDVTGLEKTYNLGRPVHVLAMHNFNWEFANWWVSANAPIPFYGIYLPVGNRHFDRMMYRMRAKYGTRLIPATRFRESYAAVKDTHHLLGSAADQSPADPRNAWWVEFFGRRTAFVRGAERGARAARAAVVFVHFFRAGRRGHYELHTKLFTTDASLLAPGEMTKAYTQYVEASVRSRPSNYLWSHRRWKHEWKEEYADQAI
jgi:KDO2-lipid IV(A) lauroyltransferase